MNLDGIHRAKGNPPQSSPSPLNLLCYVMTNCARMWIAGKGLVGKELPSALASVPSRPSQPASKQRIGSDRIGSDHGREEKAQGKVSQQINW